MDSSCTPPHEGIEFRLRDVVGRPEVRRLADLLLPLVCPGACCRIDCSRVRDFTGAALVELGALIE
jgi:hypothetical protein